MKTLGAAGTSAIAALALGLAVIALGVFECAPDAHRWGKLGWILSAVALPAVITTQVRRVTRVSARERAEIEDISAHERAEIHNEGYRTCLDHIARGMLLVADPSGPAPGDPIKATHAHNGVRLCAVPDPRAPQEERKAL